MLTDYTTVLKLMKSDLGLSGEHRDEYLLSLISAADRELDGRAVHLCDENIEHAVLLSDYSAWKYRKRITGEPMPEHLKLSIRNAQVKNRAGGTA